MGDKNPIRTLRDYSKPSLEGYRNTIELPKGNNVVPLRSDTIRLVQNGCSFHKLWSKDPNQHLKDFLKLVDSLDLNVNKITTSCEICSGPHDTQHCMKDPEQAFIECASSRTDEAGEEDSDVMFIEIILKDDNSQKEEPEAGEQEVEYFDIFSTRSELVLIPLE
ncbi:hypothetical protein Tco_0491332 [Tanacetum coccineum]